MQSPGAALLLSGCARMGCIKFRRFFAKVDDVLTRANGRNARRFCARAARRDRRTRFARFATTLPDSRSFRTNSRRGYHHSRL
jgi:hypothetical protein